MRARSEHDIAPVRRPRAPTKKPARTSSSAADTPLHWLALFAQGNQDVLWLADSRTRRLIYVSPQFEVLWGASGDTLLSDPECWNRAVLDDDAAQLPHPFFADDALETPALREYRVIGRDGRQHWIRDRRFRVRGADGHAQHIAGIAEDVTERKEREREREALLQRERSARAQAESLAEAKDDFLAVVTHELRSPLNAIRGWSHVLRRSGSLSEPQLKALDAIDRGTQAQARLVDDLLDSQRILCGDLQLALSQAPLPALIDEAVDDVRPAAQHKRIRLAVEHEASIEQLRVDPQRLRQALAKLLSNAVKFTPEDGVVQVRSVRRASGVGIEVKDSGIGLDAGQVRAVFGRFGQADSSSTRRQSGLGLGLSLARQLIELHGGHIDVHSAGAGLGATFSIELPEQAMASDGALPVAAPPEADAPASPLAGKRIVIVEDDADAREMLELILRDAQADARSFERATHAYKYLAQAPGDERPDALISDIAMPDEDGYAFMRRLRELEQREQRPRLVALALTAFASPADRARALAAGFDVHAAKPIDSQRVVRALAQALDVPTTQGEEVAR